MSAQYMIKTQNLLAPIYPEIHKDPSIGAQT